jgi:hypothetical protein
MPSSSALPDPAPPQPDSTKAPADPPLFSPSATFYELLQLPATASQQQLRQSFRRLSKRYHPDTTTLPVEVSARAFQRLQRAYSVLSDPQARRLYDEQLRPLPAPRPAPPGAARRAPVSVRRALSGGEWFALLLLALALLLSLVLGIGVAWARGAELVRWPSWLAELHPTALAVAGDSPGDGMVGTPQSTPLTADAPHVPAF